MREKTPAGEVSITYENFRRKAMKSHRHANVQMGTLTMCPQVLNETMTAAAAALIQCTTVHSRSKFSIENAMCVNSTD